MKMKSVTAPVPASVGPEEEDNAPIGIRVGAIYLLGGKPYEVTYAKSSKVVAKWRDAYKELGHTAEVEFSVARFLALVDGIVLDK